MDWKNHNSANLHNKATSGEPSNEKTISNSLSSCIGWLAANDRL
jgi:hypothetical protein